MNDYGTDLPGASEPEDRGPWYDVAVRRVQSPGSLLQLFGIISLFITVVYTALLFVSPDIILRDQYAFIAKFQERNVAQKMPPYEEWVKSQQIQNAVFQVLALVGSIVIFIAGGRMKQLQSYGLCMTGSILAALPLCTHNCCCFSTPIGIWAIVVLINPDVKLAFARNMPAAEEPL